MSGTTDTQHKWTDVLGELAGASEELAVGQLITHDNFSLEDAMSALELMDPKMDPGMNAAQVRTYEERLHLKSVPSSSSLSVKEVIGVIDRLMTFQAMWIDGFPIANTLFSCMYLPTASEVLDDRVLSTFIPVLLSQCILIKAIIDTTGEEDDFFRGMYGFDFPEIDAKKAIAEMNKAENELANNSTKPIQDDPAKELEYRGALLARLRFAKAWFNTLSKLSTYDLAASLKALDVAKIQLEIINKNTSLGEVPEAVFESEIARRISIGHPRKIEPISFDKTFEYYQQTFRHFTVLVNLPETTKLEDMRWKATDLVDDGASILTRAAFMKLFHQDGKILGKEPIIDWLIRDAKDCACIPESYFKYDFVQEFVKIFGQVYTAYMTLSSWTKARRRRKIPALFREWAILSDGASRVDKQITEALKLQESSVYFILWVLDKSHQTMLSYLQIGFDLELYDEQEYLMIYWFMDTIHANRMQQHNFLLKYAQSKPEPPAARQGGKNKKIKKPVSKPSANVQITPTPYNLEISCEFELCRSTLRYLMALEMEDKLPKPQFRFGSAAKRFDVRFNAFYLVPGSTPTYVQYEQYQKDLAARKIHRPNDDYLTVAGESFKNTKAQLEKLINHPKGLPKWRQERYRAMLKVVITNSVYMMTVKAKKLHKSALHQPQFNFSVHPSYATINMVEKK
eukprot:TRINITY_DN11298_c0_g1_i1.p1 TRINITY_DN11298_c0_g1~~TRINITY_DN11298_c0_g1_i1.p1  ORF type:complete len:683 (-),score=165.81 TRINITY_DN11298_c0_g1_i1:78-2126(-)